MRDILITLMVFATIPAIFYRPYVGVLVWSWLAYMVPHRLAWGFAATFPFAQIVGVVTLISLLFSSEKKRIPINAVTVVWIAYVIWMNITTLFALSPDMAMIEWDRVMKIQLFSFISLMLMYGRDRINYLIIVIVVSIGLYSVKGGLFAFFGGTGRVYGPSGGFFEDNNSMGLAAVMMLPLMAYLYSIANKRYLKLAMIGVLGFTVLAILSTQSRGAFLAVSTTIAYLWYRSTKKTLIGIVILCAAPVFWFSMPDHWHDRMATIKTYEEDGSAMGRINAWEFAYNVAVDRPIVGGGFRVFQPDNFERYAPDPENFHDAHSIYFEILGEHGFVGLTLFLLLGFLAYRAAGQVIKMTKWNDELGWANMLGRMMQACLVAYATGGLFLGLAYWDLYYHFIVIVVLLREHVNSVLADNRRQIGENLQPAGEAGRQGA